MEALSNKTPFSAPLQIRFVGPLLGRYSFPLQEGSHDGDPVRAVYACRTQSLSPTTVTVAAPVSAEVGQGVTLLIEHIGFLKGTITRQVGNGFQVELAGGPQDQRKLAAKINWLKSNRLRRAPDKRDSPRRLPRNPRAHYYLEDGEEHSCFVIDFSLSGAGLSSKHRPAIGAVLTLGSIRGHVVRHMETGFGVQFDQAPDPGTVESSIAFQRQSPPVD